MEPLINRVAESEIEVFNLESLIERSDLAELDISQFLDKGFILREKEFRNSVKEFDWSTFQSKNVALYCSTDAIVPTWAYMLISVRLNGIAELVVHGRPDNLAKTMFRDILNTFDWSVYQDKIVVVKGCSSTVVPEDAYLHATTKLLEVARKVMYGEPCSSVPLWRRPKVATPSK
ncbi:MAG: DUF2480 family protein [Rhodothermales bacterium]|nr:DUF2480 family protein [Rhodothermales bacterium]